jgi:hypothetical protein
VARKGRDGVAHGVEPSRVEKPCRLAVSTKRWIRKRAVGLVRFRVVAGRSHAVALNLARSGMLADNPEFLAWRSVEAHPIAPVLYTAVAVALDRHKAGSSPL